MTKVWQREARAKPPEYGTAASSSDVMRLNFTKNIPSTRGPRSPPSHVGLTIGLRRKLLAICRLKVWVGEGGDPDKKNPWRNPFRNLFKRSHLRYGMISLICTESNIQIIPFQDLIDVSQLTQIENRQYIIQQTDNSSDKCRKTNFLLCRIMSIFFFKQIVFPPRCKFTVQSPFTVQWGYIKQARKTGVWYALSIIFWFACGFHQC